MKYTAGLPNKRKDAVRSIFPCPRFFDHLINFTNPWVTNRYTPAAERLDQYGAYPFFYIKSHPKLIPSGLNPILLGKTASTILLTDHLELLCELFRK